MSTPIHMSAERTGGGKTGDKSVSPGGAWLVPAARARPSPWEAEEPRVLAKHLRPRPEPDGLPEERGWYPRPEPGPLLEEAKL